MKCDELKDNKQNLEDHVAYFQKKASDFQLMSDIRRVKIKELTRALWLTRTMRAEDRANKILRDSGIMFAIGDCRGEAKFDYDDEFSLWDKMERKCLKKAEEYK